MTVQPFELQPFAPNRSSGPPEHNPLGINGTVQRVQQWLMLRYVLTGELSTVEIPPTSPHPTRLDNLWQTTCFEFFLAAPNSEPYWEFNLSPSQDWNVYRFSAYRSGMAPESSINSLPFKLSRTATTLTVDICLELTQLPPVVANASALEIAISAVIASNQGEHSYWALFHPSEQADFHSRDSFVLKVPGQKVMGIG